MVDYKVISFSSKDERMMKRLRQSGIYEHEDNHVCWVSERNRGFPQSVIVDLGETMFIDRIDIVAHPDYIPSSITAAFGIPSHRFRKTTGHSYDADYSIKGEFDFVEDGREAKIKQVLYTEGEAHYIRFTVHGFYSSPINKYRQVGIISLIINGDSTSDDFPPSTSSSPVNSRRISPRDTHHQPRRVHSSRRRSHSSSSSSGSSSSSLETHVGSPDRYEPRGSNHSRSSRGSADRYSRDRHSPKRSSRKREHSAQDSHQEDYWDSFYRDPQDTSHRPSSAHRDSNRSPSRDYWSPSRSHSGSDRSHSGSSRSRSAGPSRSDSDHSWASPTRPSSTNSARPGSSRPGSGSVRFNLPEDHDSSSRGKPRSASPRPDSGSFEIHRPSSPKEVRFNLPDSTDSESSPSRPNSGFRRVRAAPPPRPTGSAKPPGDSLTVPEAKSVKKKKKVKKVKKRKLDPLPRPESDRSMSPSHSPPPFGETPSPGPRRASSSRVKFTSGSPTRIDSGYGRIGSATSTYTTQSGSPRPPDSAPNGSSPRPSPRRARPGSAQSSKRASPANSTVPSRNVSPARAVTISAPAPSMTPSTVPSATPSTVPPPPSAAPSAAPSTAPHYDFTYTPPPPSTQPVPPATSLPITPLANTSPVVPPLFPTTSSAPSALYGIQPYIPTSTVPSALPPASTTTVPSTSSAPLLSPSILPPLTAQPTMPPASAIPQSLVPPYSAVPTLPSTAVQSFYSTSNLPLPPATSTAIPVPPTATGIRSLATATTPRNPVPIIAPPLPMPTLIPIDGQPATTSTPPVVSTSVVPPPPIANPAATVPSTMPTMSAPVATTTTTTTLPSLLPPPLPLQPPAAPAVPPPAVNPPPVVRPVFAPVTPLAAPPSNLYSVDNLTNKPSTILPVQPITSPTVPPPMPIKPINLKDDSDDEEILFTQDMINRLNTSLTNQGEKPRPTTGRLKSDERGRGRTASKERPGSKRPKSGSRSRPGSSISLGRPGSGLKGRPTSSVSSITPMADPDKPLSTDDLAKVLREIENYDDNGAVPGDADFKDKKYYFRTRMAEFQNTIRLLEQKKEQAVFKEEYGRAAGITKCIDRMKSREEPLKELLIERMDAINNNNFDLAQKKKDQFDLNLEAALDVTDLHNYITPKELERLRADAKKPPL